VTGDRDLPLTQVKIVNAAEGGTNYFYVGWIDEGDFKLRFARVEASVANNDPEVVPLAAADEISNFDYVFSGVQGRPSYGIASGEDNQGNSVLGVLYAQDDSGDEACWFRSFKVTAGEIVGHTTARRVSSNGDCRFPHLFFNPATKRFMATYVDG